MNRRMLLLLTLIAILAAFTGWLSYRSSAPAPRPSSAAETLPDYYLNGLEAIVTNSSGKPSHRMTAESLTHYPADDSTTLQQPEVTVFSQQGERWLASAELGTMYAANDELLLSGAVRLESNGGRPLQLTTEWLRINTQQQYAQTDAPVVLQSAGARIEGIGMQAFGAEQRLLLNANVRGNYAVD